MPDEPKPREEPMEETMDPRDVERAKPKRVLRDDPTAAESALAASDTHESVRPKQLN